MHKLNKANVQRLADIAKLDEIGYQAVLFDPGEALASEDAEGRRLAKALGVAAFGAMNVMMFTVPVWAGANMGEGMRTFLYWAAAIVATDQGSGRRASPWNRPPAPPGRRRAAARCDWRGR